MGPEARVTDQDRDMISDGYCILNPNLGVQHWFDVPMMELRREDVWVYAFALSLGLAENHS